MDHVIVAMPLIIALVALALAFDFINGLHDAANSIATVVSTNSLQISIVEVALSMSSNNRPRSGCCRSCRAMTSNGLR